MKHIKIIVPEDKCPLDVLAEMKDHTKNARIFFHQNVLKKLKETADSIRDVPKYREYIWHATKEYPKTILDVEKNEEECLRVYRIYAADIAFSMEVENPDKMIVMEMA